MAKNQRSEGRSNKADKSPPPSAKGEPTEGVIRSLIANHAPETWTQTISLSDFRDCIHHGRSLEMIVLAADIRRSTFIMKEAVDFKQFAEIIGGFVDAAAKAVKQLDGWFDKFTGDGFLAYWLVTKDDYKIGQVFTACHSLLHAFKNEVMDDLRKNSKNFPAEVGLSIGIDGGPTYPVIVADDLTVVGSSVVGAVRMVSTATSPWETVANVYLGEALYRRRGNLIQDHQVEISREYRHTKEYASQEVYPIRFLKVPI